MLTKFITFFIFIQGFPCFLNTGKNYQFNNFKAKLQTRVQKIAQKFEEQFQKGCDCQNKIIYNQCKGISEPTYIQNFPKHTSCLTEGVRMAEEPAFILPGDYVKNLDSTEVTCQKKKFICNFLEVDSILHDFVEQGEKRYLSYIGSSTGVLVSSPVFYENCLQDFDPRVRPWYIGASTGVKNTIVFFKIKTYLKRAKETAKYLVNITNIGDRASLVDLNNCQGTCSYIAKLGTQNTKNQLITEVQQNLKPSGGWKEENYEKIKDQSSYFFEKTEERKKNIITIVTDQIPDGQALKDIVNSLPYNVQLFLILIGNKNADNVFDNQTNSVFIHDKNESQYIIDILNPILNFFNKGISISKPIWSPIFGDAFGWGKLTAVTMPIVKNGTLLGVASIDIPITQFQYNFEIEETEIENLLLSESFYNQGVQVIDYPTEQQKQLTKIKFTDEGQQKTILCEGITVTGFIIMMVFLTLLVIGVILAICICKRKKLFCFSEEEAKPNQQRQNPQPRDKGILKNRKKNKPIIIEENKNENLNSEKMNLSNKL